MLLPKYLTKIKRNNEKYADLLLAQAPVESPVSSNFWHNEPVLLPYQQEYFQTVRDNKVTVCIKSRRIGISWADACYSVLEASREGGANQSYISYNREAGLQYIEDCKWWAKKLQIACTAISSERIYNDEDKDLLVYSVRFASGNRINALTSKPSNLRGKKGGVMLDEFAFHEDAQELLRAVYALLIWNDSTIRIVSTPDAFDDPFAQLIGGIESGEKDLALLKLPLDKAVNEGFYRRICLKSGTKWSKEAQKAWVSEIESIYKPFHRVELYCEFVDFRGGGIFNKEDFNHISEAEFNEQYAKQLHDECLSFDLATTAGEMGDRKKSKDPFYTFGVHMGRYKDKVFIIDIIYAQADAGDAEKLIIDWVKLKNSKKAEICLEQEPGSSGQYFIHHMGKQLPEFRIRACRPKSSKLTRARPFANTAANGCVYLLPFKGVDKYLNALHRWNGQPTPFISDAVDATTQGYGAIRYVQQMLPPGSFSIRGY